MAISVYPKFKQRLLSPGVDLVASTVKAVLYDKDARAFTTTDQFLADVSAALVGPAGAIANRSVTSGVFDGDNVTLAAVSGATPEYVLLYVDTGSAATSPLIGLLDGVTVVPNGSDVTLAWNDGATKIFSLG